MRKVKKFLCLCLVFALTIMVIGCGSNSSNGNETLQESEEQIEITFDSKFIEIAGTNAESWAEELGESPDVKYIDLYADTEENTVTLVVTEEQLQGWIDRYESLLENLCNKFEEINADYKIEYSEDYSELNLYYNLKLDMSDEAYFVIFAEAYCVCEQLFHGVASDEWKVTFNIYNSDTGKLVTTGDSDIGLEYDKEDWEASK